jgi:hypothetical protein
MKRRIAGPAVGSFPSARLSPLQFLVRNLVGNLLRRGLRTASGTCGVAHAAFEVIDAAAVAEALRVTAP